MSKVILITGAAAGLGLGIAEYLANAGHTVYGTSRHPQSPGSKIHMLVADVTDIESVKACISQLIAEQGRIDVLINNAGLGIAGPLESVSMSDVQNVFDTNVYGVIRMIQAVLPTMRSQRSGVIINISSIGSETGLPYRGVYSASKAAVDRLTEALRMELAPFGVQACIIQAGGVKTNINKNRIYRELPSENVYKSNFETAYEIIKESVDKGMELAVFGKLIQNILQQPKIRAVYRVGARVEKFSVLLKRLLPRSYFELMIRKHYGLK